jgi:hypothetical protein
MKFKWKALEKKIYKKFPIQTLIKLFPLLQSYPLPGVMTFKTLPCIISGSSHFNLMFSSIVVLKMFKWFHFTFTFCNYLAFEEDLVLYLSKLEIPQSKDNLYQIFIEIASTSLQNKILNFSPIKTYKNVFPYCDPNESP